MRTLYLESLFSKGMHLELAQCKWQLGNDVEDEPEELVRLSSAKGS
jgi:hypothetical protein